MLAVDENRLYVHQQFGYSLPRINGKNEVVLIKELYSLKFGEKVLHTAHRTSTSHSCCDRLFLLQKVQYFYFKIITNKIFNENENNKKYLNKIKILYTE